MKILQQIRTLSIDTRFVPQHQPVNEAQIAALTNFLKSFRKILVVTGAGISTESGIPDYRSSEVGLYARKNHKPVEFMEFVRSEAVRKRYWARNYVAWPDFSRVQPNQTHSILRDLQVKDKVVTSIITQNVDNLHHKAGSPDVIELHGCGYSVRCLSCTHRIDRHELQQRLDNLNPHFVNTRHVMMRPDGDVELSPEQFESFRMENCSQCGGLLQPDIVFFGDCIPKERVLRVNRLLDDCEALLVLGSSLTVYSSYRLAVAVNEMNKYVAIVNIGPTRADWCADVKISAKCGELLPRVYDAYKAVF